MIIHHPISVTTTDTGIPLAFTWQSVRYLVVAEPELWFDKLPWWRSVTPTSQLVSLEQSLWRVLAVACVGPRSLQSEAPEEGIYDLLVTAEQTWFLSAAHANRHEFRLFA